MFIYIQRIVLTALAVALFCACSSSDEQQAEKGRIEQTTDKIAKEAVSSIKAPLDKAQMAKELTEQHNSAIEKNSNLVEK